MRVRSRRYTGDPATIRHWCEGTPLVRKARSMATERVTQEIVAGLEKHNLIRQVGNLPEGLKCAVPIVTGGIWGNFGNLYFSETEVLPCSFPRKGGTIAGAAAAGILGATGIGLLFATAANAAVVATSSAKHERNVSKITKDLRSIRRHVGEGCIRYEDMKAMSLRTVPSSSVFRKAHVSKGNIQIEVKDRWGNSHGPWFAYIRDADFYDRRIDVRTRSVRNWIEQSLGDLQSTLPIEISVGD